LIDEVVNVNPTQIFQDIINHLHNTRDYEDNLKSFVDKRILQYENLFVPPPSNIVTQEVFTYKQDLTTEIPNTSSYSNDGLNNIKVNGVVVDITYRTLPTDSVVVDALLGQGEALDCFYLNLQDAAVVSANLENQIKQQAMEIINTIGDPIQKATMYKKVFTDCCDVPQSGCGCNVTDSNLPV
jgi:hypothetical protein